MVRFRFAAVVQCASMQRKSQANPQVPKQDFQPHVPASTRMAELTWKAVLVGMILAVVFGAANAYLGLRVGLTVSASIPAAVMAIAIFRVIRRGTILETNIVQTIGSSGESLAAGVIFTIPALFLWGMSVNQLEVFTLACLGGLLGVLFMIPLRRFLIAREHGKLPYPEGTACAQVQIAGQTGGTKAKLVFGGLGVGGLYKFLGDSHATSLWNESPHIALPGKATVGADATPELLGVGYIIGWRIALIMFSGGALAWLILIPLINLFGGSQVIYPGTDPIATMSPHEIWSRYIRYIGAGSVAYGGAITLIKSFPTMIESIRLGLGKFSDEMKAQAGPVVRTDHDIPLKIVGLSALVVALLLYLLPGVPVNLPGALLIVIFSFFFVTVSSRIVGLIGASSNPISGMTIGTLIATSLIFVALGMGKATDARIHVLAVGAVVCIASAIAGDASQDLKTGFLLGATPWKQQIAEIIGVLCTATVMGAILIMLHGSYGIGTASLPAPQATLMALVIDGVLNANLPWTFVIGGMVLAAVVEHIFRQPSLAFAVGLYLPISLSTPIMIGGLLRKIIESRSSGPALDAKCERGILFSSGLIAGAALTGVVIAAVIFFAERVRFLNWLMENWSVQYNHQGVIGTGLGILAFALLALGLYRVASSAKA